MSVLRIPKRNIILVNLILVLVVILSTEARAETYGFKAITANSVADVAIGEAQLFVDVTDAGHSILGNQVLFTFSNAGPVASSITDIYFDDGPLLGLPIIDSYTGTVSFSQGANPGNLPSANSAFPPFQTSTGFSADSDSPVYSNGVNPGETVGILFNLDKDVDGNPYTFNDVINAINVGLDPSNYYYSNNGTGPYDG